MLHEIQEVGVKELRPRLLIGSKLLEEVEENVESYLSHIPHGVLEGPHHRVHQYLELGGRNLEVCWWREGGQMEKEKGGEGGERGERERGEERESRVRGGRDGEEREGGQTEGEKRGEERKGEG